MAARAARTSFAQLPLGLAPAGRVREPFVLCSSNAEAAAALDAWPRWPDCALAVVGPEGSGKSHLARRWAERAGAQVLHGLGRPEAAVEAPGPVLVEDADREPAAEALFHLINRAALGWGSASGGGLLLTARTPPSAWPTDLPDLRSRLNALRVVEVLEPDDAALTALLLGFFQERQLEASEELLAYLVRRIERSAAAAEAVASRLDDASLATRRPLTKALAREVLEDDQLSLDLAE